MKTKRILSALLCCMLLFALLPTAALAVSDPVAIAGTHLNHGVYYKFAADGTSSIGTSTDYNAWFDADKSELHLKGLNITATNGIEATSSITIVLESDGNSITTSNDPGIYLYMGGAAFDLTVTGSGSLTVNCNGSGNAIYVSSLTVQGGAELTANAATATGLVAKGGVVVQSGGKLTGISATGTGVYSEKGVTVSGPGSELTGENKGGDGTSNGVFSEESISVSVGGKLTGISETSIGVYSENSVTVSGTGSVLTATATGKGNGLASGNGLTVQNGGKLTATGGANGLEVNNGQFIVNGGEVECTSTGLDTASAQSGVKAFNLNIEVKGGGKLTGISETGSGVTTDGSVTVSGDGSVLTGENKGASSVVSSSGVYATGAITVSDGGKLAGTSATGDGVTTSGGITVGSTGSVLTATATATTANGLTAAGNGVSVSGGKLTATGKARGLEVKNAPLTVTGGEVEGTSDAGYGVSVSGSGSKIEVSGGKLTGTGEYHGLEVKNAPLIVTGGEVGGTSDAGHGVSVSGNNIEVKGDGKLTGTSNAGCGVYCGGKLTVSGNAVLTVTHGAANDMAGLIADGEITISGGTVTISDADRALEKAPNLDDYADRFLIVRLFVDDTDPAEYYADDIINYVYFHVEPTYNVTGTVTYSDTGAGLAGATVRLRHKDNIHATPIASAVTDAGGTYTLKEVPAGTDYIIEVVLSPYNNGMIAPFDVSGNVEHKDIALTTSSNSVRIDGITYTASTTGKNWKLTFDPTDVNEALLELKGHTGNEITAMGNGSLSLTIDLTGENIIEAEDFNTALSTDCALTFTGGGSLTLSSGKNAAGLSCGALTFDGGKVIANGGAGQNGWGINCGDLVVNSGSVAGIAGEGGRFGIKCSNMTVKDGTVTGDGQERGIYSVSKFEMTGGSVTAIGRDAMGADGLSLGLYGKGSVTISGGVVKAVSGEADVSIPISTELVNEIPTPNYYKPPTLTVDGFMVSVNVSGMPRAAYVPASFDTYRYFSNEPVYDVSGKVKGDTGAALEGATVQLMLKGAKAGDPVTTGADGKYTIPDAPAGGYTIEVSMAGYDTGTASVTVDDAAVTASDITLAKTIVPPSYGGYAVPVTVYNDPSIPNATVWLTGSGLPANDLLITERLSSGSDYNALLKLADKEDVFRVYNIRLQSGKTATGSAMYLHFDLASSYANQAFTLVHKLADGTYEYYYATADVNGDLVFGPMDSLSPFMLVKGTLAPQVFVPDTVVTTAPKTGDNATLLGWAMLMAAVLGAGGMALNKKRM